jgi:hypothetical protein
MRYETATIIYRASQSVELLHNEIRFRFCIINHTLSAGLTIIQSLLHLWIFFAYDGLLHLLDTHLHLQLSELDLTPVAACFFVVVFRAMGSCNTDKLFNDWGLVLAERATCIQRAGSIRTGWGGTCGIHV